MLYEEHITLAALVSIRVTICTRLQHYETHMVTIQTGERGEWSHEAVYDKHPAHISFV